MLETRQSFHLLLLSPMDLQSKDNINCQNIRFSKQKNDLALENSPNVTFSKKSIKLEFQNDNKSRKVDSF